MLRNLLLIAAFAVTAARAQFAISGMRQGTATRMTARTFASPNGKIQLTLEETDATPMKYSDLAIVASVWKQKGDTKDVLWTTNFKGSSVHFLAPSDVIVSDEGDFFVLTIRSGNEVILYRKDGAISLKAARWSRSRQTFLSLAEHLTAVDTLNGQRIVRIWDRDFNAWNAFSVADGRTVSFEPAVADKWNEATRQGILEKLAARERERLRQKVGRMGGPLRKLANASVWTNSPVVLKEVDYEFLTLLRNPADRKWIEALLRDNENKGWRGPGGSPEKDLYVFEATDFYKARADWLLGVWDKKVKPEMAPQEMWGDEGKLPRFALGKVRGTVKFATTINLFNKKSAGDFYIRLLPVDQADKAEPVAESEIAETIPNRPEADEELVDEVAFNFTTVPPGNYVLKAVWDRHKPASPYSAGPGDYESAISKIITVTAGNVVSNVVLYCTNRVAGGESYYAMDEVIRQRWKETGEYARFTFAADPDGGFDTFSRKAAFWIVRTNVAEATNCARVARMGLRTWKKPNGTQIARPDTLVVQFDRRAGEDVKKLTLPAGLNIVDEHGCVFEHKYFTKWKDSATFTFFSFPRADASWRLVGYGSVTNAERLHGPLAFDYTVTNLVRTARATEPPAIALPQVVDLGPVKMTVSKVSEAYYEPEIEATFVEGFVPSFTWAIQEAYAVDQHGNFLRPTGMCREEKSFRVIGRAQNVQPKSASVPFEFAVSREKIGPLPRDEVGWNVDFFSQVAGRKWFVAIPVKWDEVGYPTSSCFVFSLR